MLVHRSPRGVTMLQGQGMYTHKDHDVLLTCVKNRQLTQLKLLVNSVDKKAFMIINDSFEVRGQGFQSLQTDVDAVLNKKDKMGTENLESTQIDKKEN